MHLNCSILIGVLFCSPLGVIPVLVGPLQVLVALLPGIAVAVGTVVVSLFRPRVLKQLLLLAWRLRVSLLAAAAVVGLCVWGLNTLWPRGAGPVGEAEQGSGEWTVFRGSLARRGAGDDQPGPNSPDLVWTFHPGRERFYSSPAVVGNRLYIASADPDPLGMHGSIYCLDADTGGVVWKGGPPKYQPTFSSPVVAGRYLVCGEGLHFTNNARVVCLDLQSSPPGAVAWTFTTVQHVECTPAIDGDSVYVNGGDDGIYCLHLAPQPEGGSQVKWHLPGDRYPDAETSLAVWEGKVYAGLGNDGQALCILDAQSGKEIKRLPTPYPVFGAPAIRRGRLVVGMGQGDFVKSADEVREETIQALRDAGKGQTEIDAARERLAAGGAVWCLDLASDEVLWKFPLSDTVVGAVSAAEEGYYFATRSGEVFCLSPEGKQLARWNARSPILASLAVAPDLIYAVTQTGMLYALDRRTLAPRWETRFSSGPLCLSSPAVARGHLYLGSERDGLICLGLRTDKTADGRAAQWAGRLAGPGRGGCIDQSPLPEEGYVHWSNPVSPKPANHSNPLTAAPVAALGADVVVPLQGEGERGLVCLASDAAESDAPRVRWRAAWPGGSKVSPALVENWCFGVEAAATEGRSPRLWALESPSGKPRWSCSLQPGGGGSLSIDRDLVVCPTDAETLAAWTLQGKSKWQTHLGPLSLPPAIAPAMIIAAADAPPRLVALDRASGRELWKADLGFAATTSPIPLNNSVLLGTTKGLRKYSLIDGSEVASPHWKSHEAAVASDVVLAGDKACYVDEWKELLIVNLDDGDLHREVAGAIPGIAPLVARRKVLFAAPGGLKWIDLDDARRQPALWCETADLGELAAPLVLHDSCVYGGWTKAGLVRMGAAP